LGFWVTYQFIRKGNPKAAAWQTIWSHLAMLFVLIVGWDGTGYKRFFYAGNGTEWHSGVTYPISAFFSAEIFYTLLGMGVFLVPTYVYLINYFRKQT
jgi:hypothetical protein